uniref:Uncharacterized protein n=1 Tax=Arundo donax TaxID=35708 RepID=A0A0A9FT63_ARUDO
MRSQINDNSALIVDDPTVTVIQISKKKKVQTLTLPMNSGSPKQSR